jgi:hypothetical protein
MFKLQVFLGVLRRWAPITCLTSLLSLCIQNSTPCCLSLSWLFFFFWIVLEPSFIKIIPKHSFTHITKANFLYFFFFLFFFNRIETTIITIKWLLVNIYRLGVYPLSVVKKEWHPKSTKETSHSNIYIFIIYSAWLQ